MMHVSLYFSLHKQFASGFICSPSSRMRSQVKNLKTGLPLISILVCVAECCEICGSALAGWMCSTCSINKCLCEDCDATWHKHPSRKEHKRLPLGSGSDPEVFESLPSEGPPRPLFQQSEESMMETQLVIPGKR